MAKKSKAPKKAAPAPVKAKAPAPVKKETIMDKCPPTRSISDWCKYVAANSINFTAEEVTEAREHIQKTNI